MQNVSDKWLEAQEVKIQPECFVSVTVQFNDPQALYMASAVAEPELELLSDVEAILSDSKTHKYGTLEENIWILDGSVSWPDSTGNENAGYISKILSDENGVFSEYPVITITPLESVNNNYGVTITWSDAFEEYPKEFVLNFYYQSELITSITVADNDKIICPVETNAESYDEFEIIIHSWCLPYRRARIEHVIMGYERKFEKDSLIDFSVEQNVNPLSASLPENILNFSLDMLHEQQSTLEKYFRRGQEITAQFGMYTGYGKEMIRGGTYYLDTWEIESDGLKGNFTAKSVIYMLNQLVYDEGVYSANGTNLYTLAENVLKYAVSKTNYKITWKMTAYLKDIKTTAPLPVCSCAECLQLIANAGGCTLICGRDNEIKILRTSYSATSQPYVLQELTFFDYPKLSLQTELSTIKANIYSYQLKEYEDTEKTSEKLYNGVHYVDGSADITIQYVQSANVTGSVTPYLASENIEIVSEGYFSSYSKFKITGKGYVAINITGRPLETNISEYHYTLSDDGSEETISNPLITDESIASLVCRTAVAWAQNKNELAFSYRSDPRLDAGDFVEYQENDILISHLKYNFTGMFRGEISGRIGTFITPDESESDLINDAIWPDLNNDGKADSVDAQVIRQAAADIAVHGESGLTPLEELKADANRDGGIKASDAALVQLFSTMVGTGDYEQSPDEWNRFLKNQGIL